MRKRDKLKAIAKKGARSPASVVASLLGASVIAAQLRKNRREEEKKRRYFETMAEDIIELGDRSKLIELGDAARYKRNAKIQSTYYKGDSKLGDNVKVTTGSTAVVRPETYAAVPTDTDAGKRYHEAEKTIKAIKEQIGEAEYEKQKNDSWIKKLEQQKSDAIKETAQNNEFDYVNSETGEIIPKDDPSHPYYDDSTEFDPNKQIEDMQKKADQLGDPPTSQDTSDLNEEISDTEDDLADKEDDEEEDDDPTTTIFPVTTTIDPGYVAAAESMGKNLLEFGIRTTQQQNRNRLKTRQRNIKPVSPKPSTPTPVPTPPSNVPNPQDIDPVPDINPSPGPGPHVPGGGGSKGDYDDPVNVKLRQLLFIAQRNFRNKPTSPFSEDDFKEPKPESVSDAEDDVKDQEDEEEDEPDNNVGLPGPDGDPGPPGPY